MKRSFISSIAILVGTIIGAGIFGIPYVISKSGLITGLAYFFILGGAALLIHLFFGEIVLRTGGKERVIGHAQRYLGKGAKIIVSITTIIGLVGSLLAYAIIAGDFLKIVLGDIFAGNTFFTSSFYLTLIFILVFSFFIFRGTKTVAPIEIFTNVVFFLIIFAIFYFGLPKINMHNFSLFDGKNIFLPFGVIIFSMIGWTAIPELFDVLKTPEEKKNLKKIIILGTIFPIILYLFFSLTVWGVSGSGTSQDALSGLVPFLGQRVVFFGALAAIFTLADSFLIIGLCLKHILNYDLKIPKTLSSFLVCSLPLALFLVGFRSFIDTIGIIGTILGVVDGIMIILIYRKAKIRSQREPEYSLKVPPFLFYILVLIFLLGAVAQILYNI